MVEQATEPKILLGYLQGLWGIQGWLKVFSYSTPHEQIGKYKNWLLGTDISRVQGFELERFQARRTGLVAKLARIDDRTEAAKRVGQKIWVDAEQLEVLPEGEYYWFQLIGLQVVNRRGQKLGIVKSLMETGAHDVLVVDGDRQRLIPYVKKSIVTRIDLPSKTIEVDWGIDF